MWHYYYKVISNANAIINYVDPESSHKFKYIYAQALTYLSLIHIFVWIGDVDGRETLLQFTGDIALTH